MLLLLYLRTFEGVGFVLLVAGEVLQEVPEAALLEDAHQGRAQRLIWRCRHLAAVVQSITDSTENPVTFTVTYMHAFEPRRTPHNYIPNIGIKHKPETRDTGEIDRTYRQTGGRNNVIANLSRRGHVTRRCLACYLVRS